MSSLKIGIISTMDGFPWGGSEELWAATALEALKAGHEVFVSVHGWADEAPKVGELERHGAKIFRRGAHFSFREPSGTATSKYRDLFKTNPDVIVISQGATFDLLDYKDLVELLYVSPIPYVLINQYNDAIPSLTDPSRRETASRIFSRAFRVLFVADRNRVEAERQLATKIPNAHVVLNPVNLADHSYLSWPGSKTARFASVARLDTRYKGQDVLLESLSSDQWRARDWHLTMYGSGTHENYLRSLVEFFGLEGRVTFAGHRSAVRAIWVEQQVLIMFSRGEGTPLALVEAMLCGRPAIVSDVGGNREWVTEPQTGFVCAAPVVELARATLERAWSVRQHWNAMGVQAHEFASARLGDPSIPRVLNVLLEASQSKKLTDTATGEERERLKVYRELIQPPINRRVVEAGKAGLRRFRNELRTIRAESHKRLTQLKRVGNVVAAAHGGTRRE